MMPKIEVKPSLLTPDMVALMWCVSVKKVYEWVNTGKQPHVLLPTDGKRKRLIRIRASVAESWIEQHEVGTTPNNAAKSPRRRRRSILRLPKGISALKSLSNEGESAGGNSKNV